MHRGFRLELLPQLHPWPGLVAFLFDGRTFSLRGRGLCCARGKFLHCRQNHTISLEPSLELCLIYAMRTLRYAFALAFSLSLP